MINNLSDRKKYLIASVTLFIISFIFCIFHLRHPMSCCDAFSYLEMIAPVYEKDGLFTSHSLANLRTYFYPWVLSFLIRLSGVTHFSIIGTIWIFQTTLYFFSIFYLTQALSRIEKNLGVTTLFFMCLNIYFLPYLSITLTDTVYTILVIFWMATMLNVHQMYIAKNIVKSYFFILLALFFSGIILVTRPAGVWVTAVTVVMFLYYFSHLEKGTFSRFKIYLALFIAGTVYFFPLFPQIYINLLHFGKVTALPVWDLTYMQTQVGVYYLKYATNLSGGQPGMLYLNPFFVGEAVNYNPDLKMSADGIMWYLKNPMHAIATFILKFVGAFDFDYITPYVYKLRPWYRWPSAFLSLSILYFGLWGIFSYLFHKTKKTLFFGPPFFPLLCLLSWGAVSCLAVYELRFGLPIIALFLIFSAERILCIQKMNHVALRKTFAVYFCMISILLFLAGYLSQQNLLLQ